MQTIPLPRNISIRQETMYGANGNRIGRVKPNELGIYPGFAMMVLGQVTQQNTYYEPESVVDQITNPQSRFNKVFKAQKAYGEYGHPAFPSTMSREDQMTRLLSLDETKISHLFTKIYTDAPSADGTIVLRADLKPIGPYGAVFKEGLDDPVINTAFSLRAFVETKINPRTGVKHRTMRQLNTFDTVAQSGFATTDKAHCIGLESFAGDTYHEYEITLMDEGVIQIDQIALEAFSDTELNEIFGVPKVSRLVQSRTYVQADQSLAARFPTLYAQNLFHEHLSEK